MADDELSEAELLRDMGLGLQTGNALSAIIPAIGAFVILSSWLGLTMWPLGEPIRGIGYEFGDAREFFQDVWKDTIAADAMFVGGSLLGAGVVGWLSVLAMRTSWWLAALTPAVMYASQWLVYILSARLLEDMTPDRLSWGDAADLTRSWGAFGLGFTALATLAWMAAVTYFVPRFDTDRASEPAVQRVLPWVAVVLLATSVGLAFASWITFCSPGTECPGAPEMAGTDLAAGVYLFPLLPALVAMQFFRHAPTRDGLSVATIVTALVLWVATLPPETGGWSDLTAVFWVVGGLLVAALAVLVVASLLRPATQPM